MVFTLGTSIGPTGVLASRVYSNAHHTSRKSDLFRPLCACSKRARVFPLQAAIQELTERRTTLKDQVQQATLAAFVNSGHRSDVQATTAAITALESQLREQATLREGAQRQVARSEHTCALALLDRADLQRKTDSIMGSVGVEGKQAVAAARAEVGAVRGQLEEAVAESAALSAAFELARGAHAAAQVLIPPPCELVPRS